MKLEKVLSKKVISAVDPCAKCGKRVIRNFIQCLKCKDWVHKRCFGIHRRLKSGINYEYGKCKDIINHEKDEKYVKLLCNKIKIVSFVVFVM